MKRLTFSVPWPMTGSETREILSFTFQIALVAYLGFFVIDAISPGFVTAYMNLNGWLWAAIITGILTAVWPFVVPDARPVKQVLSWRTAGWFILTAAGTIVVVWYKLHAMGMIGQAIAVLSGAIVFSLCLLVAYDRDEPVE